MPWGTLFKTDQTLQSPLIRCLESTERGFVRYFERFYPFLISLLLNNKVLDTFKTPMVAHIYVIAYGSLAIKWL